MIVILQNGELVKSNNGFIYALNNDVVFARVDTLRKASEVVREYIECNLLGSSCFTGGDVINDNGKLVAHVSYNGRVWTPEKWPECHEIII